MEFFPTFPTFVVSAGTSLCAGDCIYCRTFGTEEAGLSGDSGTVGRKLIKGSYSLFFLGKDYCHIYYARNFLYCGLPFFWLGCWFGSRKEALLSFLDRKKMTFFLCGLLVFWNMAVMEQSGWKMNALGSQEEYAGTIFLAICIFLLFVGWQNFYVENSLTRALAKVGKDYSMLIYVLHYAVLQALSRCFKGRRSLLAKGYHQYGMMFVFAVTVVMVAVYANAKPCLLLNQCSLERV